MMNLLFTAAAVSAALLAARVLYQLKKGLLKYAASLPKNGYITVNTGRNNVCSGT
ncbi:MAG: hypothetical protein IKN57_12125 [Parasporobacterium sp.]|nr:hypothetical protein [Parasporobacterium sp.]